MEGIYIYGIIDTAEEKSLGITGITEYGEVYTIPYQDISAVVSDSEMVNYTTLVKDVVARYLLTHQQVIEKVMDYYTIIPMRLGTYVFDKAEVKEILCKGYKKFKDIFKKIDNKIEIDVVATWSNFAPIIKEIQEEKEIKEFKEKLINNPEGITVDDQIKAGSMIENSLNKKKEEYASQIQNILNTASENLKAHELMDDKMVINTAFLIDKDKQKDFYKKIEDLNTDFNEKLNFRCVGPLSSYSFYTLEIKKMQFKEIDWARKKLALNDLTSKDEIKKAYKKLAFTLHPDINPNMPGIEKEFDEVTKAYKNILDYCQDERCSFKEEDFKKNSLIVKVRE